MSNNLTAPAAGAILATRELGGAHHTVAVLATADGEDVEAGNPLPVSIGSGPFAVTGQFYQATQPVSIAGTVTVSGALTDAQLRATPVPVSGTVAVTGTFFQATQPISATALPLPTGAATETTLGTLAGKLPTLGAKASSGSVSMTPASDATFPVSAASLPLPTGAATNAKIDEAIAAINEQRGADKFAAITPADTNLTTIPDGLFIGGAGNLVVRGSNGTDATFVVAAGSFLPIRPTQVRAATTATGIVGVNN